MLMPDDVVVDSHCTPYHLAVHFNRTKIGFFGIGSTLHLGVTGIVRCPVTEVLGYLAIALCLGPLFLFGHGSTLS